MTVGLQRALSADYAAEREERDLAALFKAHTSPAFQALVRIRANLDQPGSSNPSLDTCEQLSTSETPTPEPSGDSSKSGVNSFINTPPETGGDLEYISDATEALRASISRERPRQRRIVQLVLAGEHAHAKRYANCMRRSVQLECPPMAGGCGSDDNFVPVSCDSRLCRPCMKRNQGRLLEKYRAAVESWEEPTLLTLTIENVGDLARGKEAIQGAFGRFRERVIPPEGEQGAKRWVWRRDGGEPATAYWKTQLTAAGQFDLARRLQKRYVEQGRGIPVKELIRGGLYGIDIKQQGPGEYNVHLHVVCDMAFIPQEAISSVWEDLTGAPVVDVRRIRERGGMDTKSALLEVIGYATKPPKFESIEAEVEYLKALKGSRMVQPFGRLHGNTPEVGGLLRCCDCEIAPAYWEYKGYVDGCYETALVGSAPDGDRPPPDGGAA